MADGGQDFNLGHVVGSAGEKGDDGSTVWNTSTAPTYANNKYTFNISNLSGRTGLEIAVNDIIFYSTYYYIVSAVNSTTVDCTTRVNIKGSDASVTIVDNLTTNDATKVLSAKQGKVLNDNKLEKTHSSYKGKNVVTNASTGTIEFEDKPTIPSKVSDLQNDTGFITSTSLPTKTSDLTNDGADGTNIFVANNDSRLSDARTPSSHTHGQITNAGAITSTAVTVASGDNIVITDASDSSKVKRVANILADHVKDGTAHTNIGSSASATQSTINSSIDTALGNKQATLVSGTNIKTVNNESLLGSGNITIQGGSSVDVVTSWESTLSDSKVPSEKLVKNTIDGLSIPTKTSDLTNDGDGTNAFLTQHQSLSNYVQKSSTSGLMKNDGTVDTNSYLTTGTASSTYQPKLTSGTNIKTINNESLLGSGNITVGGGSSVDIVTAWESTPSDSKVPSEKLTKETINALNVFDIGQNNSTNAVCLSKDIDSDGKGMAFANAILIYNENNDKLYYDKNTNRDTDSGNELATMNDIPSLANYVQKSSTSGLLKNDGSIDTSSYITSSAISGMLTTSDVVDNLTSTSATAPLSAKQGKVLNDLIGQAIAYINQ